MSKSYDADHWKAVGPPLLKALENLMAELDAEWQSNDFANRKEEAREAIAEATA